MSAEGQSLEDRSDFSCFTLRLDRQVAFLTLNHPERANCLTGKFFEELPAAVALMGKKGARVMILSSASENFSAGIDLELLADPRSFNKHAHSKALSFVHIVKQFQAAITALETAPFPVLAAIDGYCLGAALDLIAACDVRFGTVRSTYAIAEINVGLMADLGSLQRLPAKMHEGLVRLMALSGRPIDARKAAQSGLLTDVFADAAGMQNALESLARQIAAKEPKAVQSTKRSLNYNSGHTVQQSLLECARLQLISIDLEVVRAKVSDILNSLKKRSEHCH